MQILNLHTYWVHLPWACDACVLFAELGRWERWSRHYSAWLGPAEIRATCRVSTAEACPLRNSNQTTIHGRLDVTENEKCTSSHTVGPCEANLLSRVIQNRLILSFNLLIDKCETVPRISFGNFWTIVTTWLSCELLFPSSVFFARIGMSLGAGLFGGFRTFHHTLWSRYWLIVYLREPEKLWTYRPCNYFESAPSCFSPPLEFPVGEPCRQESICCHMCNTSWLHRCMR